MDGLYAYCIVPGGHVPPPGLEGIGQVPVHAEPVGDLLVWATRQSERPVRELERVQQHHTVVRAAAAHVTPLPIRFGEWFPDRATLAARIALQRPSLDGRLAAVSGCVELGLRVSGRGGSEAVAGTARRDAPEGPGLHASAVPTPHEPGRRYLREVASSIADRTARKRRRERLVGDLCAGLAGLVRQQQVYELPPPAWASVAHLVRRADEDAYREAVGRAPLPGDVVVQVTGPWPPYSFAS